MFQVKVEQGIKNIQINNAVIRCYKCIIIEAKTEQLHMYTQLIMGTYVYNVLNPNKYHNIALSHTISIY